MKLHRRELLITLLALAWAGGAMAIPMRIEPSQSARQNAPPPGGFTEELNSMLHSAEQSRSRDPIGALSGEMTVIVNNLDQQETGTPVQNDQRQVVSQLDKLIEELNKQCNGRGNGNTNNPSKPMTDSRIAKGPGGVGPMHDPQAGVKSWGQLPPKERDKILQSQNDGFPAGYESILSNYYNRLAQEQVADENKNTSPATQP